MYHYLVRNQYGVGDHVLGHETSTESGVTPSDIGESGVGFTVVRCKENVESVSWGLEVLSLVRRPIFPRFHL